LPPVSTDGTDHTVGPVDAVAVDVAVVGGGLVGLATARTLAGGGQSGAIGRRIMVLEAEPRVAAHQSGHNSGVIHSGLYYRPGSLKADNCVAGREAMYRFCAERGIPHERTGKLVVATAERELPALAELERRGRANGLRGLRRLEPAEVREREPHVRAVGALLVPETGIVDFARVAEAMAEDVRAAGGTVRTGVRVLGCRREAGGLVVETSGGVVRARVLVNCAGLQSDRVAARCGVVPDVRIVPFRGEYWTLAAARRDLVRGLVYPVPDPEFPFLGVHFTRRIDGAVEAGPNAVLAFRREGYRWADVSPRDVAAMAAWAGTWRMAARYWRTGLGEAWRSLSKRAFVSALRVLVPDLRARDLAPGGAGVRAQAVLPDGRLLDDFRIVENDRMVHVLNAPSPAATASLAIGARVATLAAARLG
jgi:L-2-hydroxyglutarate oxidase